MWLDVVHFKGESIWSACLGTTALAVNVELPDKLVRNYSDTCTFFSQSSTRERVTDLDQVKHIHTL